MVYLFNYLYFILFTIILHYQTKQSHQSGGCAQYQAGDSKNDESEIGITRQRAVEIVLVVVVGGLLIAWILRQITASKQSSLERID